MDFDISIKDKDLTIYCSNNLKDFSNEFVNYFNKNIDLIKTELSISVSTKLIVALTDNKKQVNFVYGKTSFSGFFNNTGSFAYINLNGNKSKIDMFKGLMHELIHHLYKYYVYGENKERITWVDEGIAQFLSGQKIEFQDAKLYRIFIEENLGFIDNIDLNKLNHNDRSFGINNGYNLSYIAIRYLYEMNTLEEFINIIKNQDKLKELGCIIIKNIQEYYGINNKIL